MGVGKKLFEQVKDFARPTGARYTPEQTSIALKRLKESSFSPEGANIRQGYIDQLKDTKLLEDPNVERAYAVGSSVTPKPDPTDLDILYRGKTARGTFQATSEAMQEGGEDIHHLVPQMVESKGQNLAFKGQDAFDKSSAASAANIANVGSKRYGSDHEWIRLVAIPAATGLGLLATEEADAAFKPAAVSRVATELLKYNKSGVPGTGLVQGETPRVMGILENMLKIPQTEYSRVGKVTAKPFPDIMEQATVRGRFYGKTFDINLNPRKAVPETFPHEITHARQKSFLGVDNYLEDLAEKIQKWIEDPWELYYSRPNEVQARSMGNVVNKSPTELVPSLYDHVYNQELIKAITFTEKFLADKDPTFKGKFIKGTAIGGAVMTLLNLGPAENEASAMPRGVYEATEKIAGKISSTAKDLIGKTLTEGKTVKDVRKGEGINRIIYFQDGTHSTVTTKDLHTLERYHGTMKYKKLFGEKDEPAQLDQALKSMNMHEAIAKHLPPDTGVHKDLLKGYVDQYLSDLQEMGKTLDPDIVFVQRTTPEGDLLYTLPRFYAELLEEQGILSIVKSKKYIDIINQNKVK